MEETQVQGDPFEILVSLPTSSGIAGSESLRAVKRTGGKEKFQLRLNLIPTVSSKSSWGEAGGGPVMPNCSFQSPGSVSLLADIYKYRGSGGSMLISCLHRSTSNVNSTVDLSTTYIPIALSHGRKVFHPKKGAKREKG